MYNIVQNSADKSLQNMSANANATLSISTSSKVDCAKECPCGVPAIPVPDQWLEVMVTGGFKVWHIIFIIIAFVVTLIVVYCCFHRCRIPRTKQEIEADLMRSNLATKFRDYLLELPNEPTTFVEALKKVQEIEEKLEQDDAMLSRDLGARKRMGWLKLKGKGGDKVPASQTDADDANGTEANQQPTEQSNEIKPTTTTVSTTDLTNQQQSVATTIKDVDKTSSIRPDDGKALKLLKISNQNSNAKSTVADSTKTDEAAARGKATKSKNKTKPDKDKDKKHNELKSAQTSDATAIKTSLGTTNNTETSSNLQVTDSRQSVGKTNPVSATTPVKTRKKRDKPNLSRTKAAHVKSMEHNQLELPPATLHHDHRQQHQQRSHAIKPEAEHPDHPEPRQHAHSGKQSRGHKSTKGKTKESTPKDSTVIQFHQ